MSYPENEEHGLGALRVIDAALNRAAEGLRVVEDYARLILNDPHLTERTKSLRHRLFVASQSFQGEHRVASRDTMNDVGTEISTETESHRESTTGVVQANLSRVQQALRTIEEYSKLVLPNAAQAIEPLRYESYTLEKAILTTVMSLTNLKSSRLYVLIDGRGSSTEFAELVGELISAGVDIFQLRDKELTSRQLLERGKILNDLCRPQNVRWIMNDRADLAIAAGADGVHVGQDDLPVAAARRVVGPTKLIGVSTHSVEQARAAVIEGANYIGVGPIFHSQTKAFKKTLGLDFASHVAQEITLPAFAIGGINLDNVDSVLETGISRITIKGAIVDAAHPRMVAEQIKRKLMHQ
jgi:thiamine-phosphate pyrophosphorylase